MRILVIGSGGREDALLWKLAQSPLVEQLFIAPGNGGSERHGAKRVSIAQDDLEALAAFAKKERIDLVIPGPELPLTLGITDKMQAAKIPCFGPDQYCARLEGSKSFAKEIMLKAKVPTAQAEVFCDLEAARAYVRKESALGHKLVIKADGLASGKGVIVCDDEASALAAVDLLLGHENFGAADARIVIEERLEGEEVSLLCLCDGKRCFPLPSAQDHKAALDGDLGPNTGGMGAYSPAPLLPDAELASMAERTVQPILDEMARQGHPFVGVLYAGLMLTSEGPRVLEYNVRFGDPECQPLMARLEGDLAQILLHCLDGKLEPEAIRASIKSALGVVLTAKGYPGKYPKGMKIEGLDEAAKADGVVIFHSGTSLGQNNELLANGGRILCVTALGESLSEARYKAYTALGKIRMADGAWRTDIGAKGIARLEREAKSSQGEKK